MDIIRTVTILLPADDDLRATVVAFQHVQQALSAPAYNSGKPLGTCVAPRYVQASDGNAQQPDDVLGHSPDGCSLRQRAG